jgi:hypothetical protein
MILTGGKNRNIDGKSSLISTSSTTNATWTDLGANLGLHGERPASNRLGYFRAKLNLHYTQVLSAYRAVNTLRLGYTNQSVNSVDGSNLIFLWASRQIYKHI